MHRPAPRVPRARVGTDDVPMTTRLDADSPPVSAPGGGAEALRRDIRLVTTMLGETLARAEGEELLALVEQVRAHAKDDTPRELPDFDLDTVTTLVRAFTAYFHLANTTEQVHRGLAIRGEQEVEGGWVQQALARITDAGVDAAELSGLMGQVAVRPVFTAHPTEVARRSTIDKLRRSRPCWPSPTGPAAPGGCARPSSCSG